MENSLVVSEYNEIILSLLIFMVDLVMNLMNGPHHEYENEGIPFFMLREYLRITLIIYIALPTSSNTQTMMAFSQNLAQPCEEKTEI